jgi:predicted nucleotidyltransferase
MIAGGATTTKRLDEISLKESDRQAILEVAEILRRRFGVDRVVLLGCKGRGKRIERLHRGSLSSSCARSDLALERFMIRQDVLKEAARRLVEGFHPRRIMLFGSQARGTVDERSDVDLLVIAEDAGNRRGLMVAMDRALRGLGIARDIIVLTPEEFETEKGIPGTVGREAFLEGKVLYDVAA